MQDYINHHQDLYGLNLVYNICRYKPTNSNHQTSNLRSLSYNTQADMRFHTQACTSRLLVLLFYNLRRMCVTSLLPRLRLRPGCRTDRCSNNRLYQLNLLYTNVFEWL